MTRPDRTDRLAARPALPAMLSAASSTACRGLALLVLAIATPVAAQRVPFTEAFHEDFAGPLDPERWYISDGWTNGDWMACTWSSRMVSVADDVLRLTLAPTQQGSDEWLCGEIQTRPVFHYGTFEASIRTDVGSGANAAFFTYIGPVHDAPHDEIDVEILTRDTNRFDVNTYVDGEPRHGRTVPLDVSADSRFHTYAFVWEPDRIRWYINGMLVHTATGPDLPVTPQKIYMSHWNSRTFTEWMGPFVDPGRPLVMEVDWVAYTPPGEGCSFEGSLLCEPGFEP